MVERHAPPAQLQPHYQSSNNGRREKQKARMEYKGVEKPKKVRQPYAVANAQSKIKDHVAYFKNMSKNRRNRDIFSKDPQIFAKPHPSEMVNEQ